MSKNSKNIIRPEYLKNFIQKNNIELRIIITSKADSELRWINPPMIKDLNQKLNVILQELNLKTPDRQIPYMTLHLVPGDQVSAESRIIIRNYETSPVFEKDIKVQMASSACLTHLVDILVAPGYRTIHKSDITGMGLTVCSAVTEAAIIDIALDIAMFNSYSFLRNLDTAQKREASKQKYAFYKSGGDLPFYECGKEDLEYFSLAFLSRHAPEVFDVDGYIRSWDAFATRYYPGRIHAEQSPKEQIKKHVDFEELPKNVHRRFKELPAGGYLLLRTNTDRTEDLHPQILTLFGIRRYRKGCIKVVPLADHDKYKHLFENLDVSAFKVVVP